MKNQKVQLTLTGYNELVAELADLKDNKLPAAIARVAFGDDLSLPFETEGRQAGSRQIEREEGTLARGVAIGADGAAEAEAGARAECILHIIVDGRALSVKSVDAAQLASEGCPQALVGSP